MQRHLGFARSRHRLCAGASISPETLRFFDIVGRPVSQGYGLTESGGVAFIQTESHHRLGGCGLPLPQTEWKLDSDGEILLRNPGVFKGYFLDEKASTASVEPGGWLRTGDIVEVHGQWRDHAWSTARRRSSSPPAARTSRRRRSRTR